MKISIIGAGFSGLTLAYFLNKKGLDVEVLEAKSRPGGLIHTHHTLHGMVETAATSILLTPKLEELLSEINLEPLLANKESKKRYILKNNTPSRLPLSFTGILSLFRGVFRLVFSKKKWTPKSGEMLSDWGDRTFSQEVRKALISPAMQGIYAASAEQLSASLVLRKLFHKKSGSRSKGAINFNGGMGEFIEKMESHLKKSGVEFKYNQVINTENFPENPAVLATSMKHAHQLFKSIPILPLRNMTTATLFFKSPSPIEGFGVLFPKEEKLNAHGVLLNNCMFKKRTPTGHSETWIMSEVQDHSDDEILRKIKNDRIQIFKSEETPVSYQVTSWPEAFPIYSPELEQSLKEDIDLPKNVFLTGNYLGNLGLSGILEQNFELSQKLSSDLQ